MNPTNLTSDISEQTRTVSGSKIRRIVVDRAKCIGARSCAAVAPGVFEMDDGNLAYVVPGNSDNSVGPNSTDEDTILMGAQSCPVLAILLYDENGRQIFPEE